MTINTIKPALSICFFGMSMIVTTAQGLYKEDSCDDTVQAWIARKQAHLQVKIDRKMDVLKLYPGGEFHQLLDEEVIDERYYENAAQFILELGERFASACTSDRPKLVEEKNHSGLVFLLNLGPYLYLSLSIKDKLQKEPLWYQTLKQACNVSFVHIAKMVNSPDCVLLRMHIIKDFFRFCEKDDEYASLIAQVSNSDSAAYSHSDSSSSSSTVASSEEAECIYSSDDEGETEDIKVGKEDLEPSWKRCFCCRKQKYR